MSPVPGGHGKWRIFVVASAIAVACAPALTGLRGNDSFAQSVPVVIPVDARVMTAGDFDVEAATHQPSPGSSIEDYGSGSGKESHPPSLEPSQVDDSPSGSPNRKHGSDRKTVQRSPSAKMPAGRRPERPTASPTSSIEASPSPSARVDDHGGAGVDAKTGLPSAPPATSGVVEVTAAPTPVSSDDSGGHGGGGSGKGGAGN
jgi:hypothetical protein